MPIHHLLAGTRLGLPDYMRGPGGRVVTECFHMTQKDLAPEKKPDTNWPEPPGYLGEAVRRAKLIPSRIPPPEAPQD